MLLSGQSYVFIYKKQTFFQLFLHSHGAFNVECLVWSVERLVLSV